MRVPHFSSNGAWTDITLFDLGYYSFDCFQEDSPTFLHDRFFQILHRHEIFRLVPERRSYAAYIHEIAAHGYATFIRGINELMNISPMFLSACGAIDRRRVRLNI